MSGHVLYCWTPGMCVLVIVLVAHSRQSCPHAGFTALENQGSLCQLILFWFFIVTGHVQCTESWCLPPEEQCPSKHRASEYCRRMEGQCCGAGPGPDAPCSDPLQEGV